MPMVSPVNTRMKRIEYAVSYIILSIAQLLMHLNFFIYVTTLPLGFVSSFGYGTVLIAVFIFYILVSIELLAEEIEDPFGIDDNDLPLDEIALKIKANVNDILK